MSDSDSEEQSASQEEYRWEMEEILQEAGVELQLGPQSMDELEDEVDVALDRE